MPFHSKGYLVPPVMVAAASGERPVTESKAAGGEKPPSMPRGDIDDPKLAAALRTLS